MPLRRQLARAADVVLPEGVAAVDERVAGLQQAASSAIAASVAAPAGSMTHTARGVSSARTTSPRLAHAVAPSAASLRARLGIAVIHHARVALPHEPAGDVGAHAPEADDADLHGSFPAGT